MRKMLLTATAVTGLVFAPATWAQEHGAGGAGSPGGAGPASESGTSGGAPGAKSPGGAERSMEKRSPKAEGERATPNGGEMRGERGERNKAEEPGERGKAANQQMQERGEKSGAKQQMQERGEKSGANQQMQERGEKTGANTERMQEERGGTQTTAPGGAAGGTHAAANLSTEQKTKVQSSLKSVNVREAKINVTNIRVGGSVPHTVTNYWEPVPTEIVEVVPAWRSYRVVRVRGEVLIIDPATFEIVYVIA
jgi:hypothetical protein